MPVSPTGRCPRRLLLSLLVLALSAGPVHPQIGGLIKKKVEKAAGKATTPDEAPPKFDAVTVELTPERLARIVAANRTARQLAASPDGPQALKEKIGQLDERATAIYAKHVDEINAWDDSRRERERCRGDAFSVARDRINEEFSRRIASDAAFRRAWAMKGVEAQVAMEKGDTAAATRLRREIENAREPTRADSLAVDKECGALVTPALVGEYNSLRKQLDDLQEQLRGAETRLQTARTEESGLDNRQLGIACERIKLFLNNLKEKKKNTAYTPKEIEALERAIKDLEDLEQTCI